ncbi:hypothetical protein [Phormidium tenue]|uniref:hypothetical protein n=1 Tax=Phormidium tenue TaxID=126344 RepID=UPI0015C54450|nr:hypothetical protein [Phormidium tenue]MBD2234840.1 hypothetical protein [Phormidium tenue FACHB-1052]
MAIAAQLAQSEGMMWGDRPFSIGLIYISHQRDGWNLLPGVCPQRSTIFLGHAKIAN